MTNTSAKVLVDYIKKHGWLSVTNIFFNDGMAIFPTTTGGRICLSEANEVLLVMSKIDVATTEFSTNLYISPPRDRVGFLQTISVCPFHLLNHFDAMLFTFNQFYRDTGADFPVPNVPDVEDVMALEADPETGLYPGTDTITVPRLTCTRSSRMTPQRTTVFELKGIRTGSSRKENS